MNFYLITDISPSAWIQLKFRSLITWYYLRRPHVSNAIQPLTGSAESLAWMTNCPSRCYRAIYPYRKFIKTCWSAWDFWNDDNIWFLSQIFDRGETLLLVPKLQLGNLGLRSASFVITLIQVLATLYGYGSRLGEVRRVRTYLEFCMVLCSYLDLQFGWFQVGDGHQNPPLWTNEGQC